MLPGNSLDTVGCGLKLFLPEMAYESCDVAVRLHLPRRSRLMTDALVYGDLYNPRPLDVRCLQIAHNRFAGAVVGELFVAAFETSICYNALYHIICFAFPIRCTLNNTLSSGFLLS